MSSDTPSILNHMSVPVRSVARAKAFYDAVLATIGARIIFSHGEEMHAYGKAQPEFWIHRPFDGNAPVSGNGWHVAFTAASTREVDAFHAAALEAGGTDDGKPGPRPDYGPQFYGCYVRDLDGNKIEATFWDASKG